MLSWSLKIIGYGFLPILKTLKTTILLVTGRSACAWFLNSLEPVSTVVLVCEESEDTEDVLICSQCGVKKSLLPGVNEQSSSDQ